MGEAARSRSSVTLLSSLELNNCRQLPSLDNFIGVMLMFLSMQEGGGVMFPGDGFQAGREAEKRMRREGGSFQAEVRVQCLAQGHFDMWTV